MNWLRMAWQSFWFGFTHPFSTPLNDEERRQAFLARKAEVERNARSRL